MTSSRNRKAFSGLVMASSLAWLSIVPATAVFAQSPPTVTPGSVTLSGPITPTNGSATFTASASDPNGTAEYQFWVESPTGQWTDAQNYSTHNTFTLATPSAGDYLVSVEVMDQAQVAASDWNMAETTLPDGVFNGSSLLVTSNATGSVALDTSVTLTATASGIFDPQYQFWYQEPNGTWVQSGNYGSTNTFTFTASQAGTYKYVAYVKSPLAANNAHGALQSTVGTQVAINTLNAGYVEEVPQYAGQELLSTTVIPGAMTSAAFQLVNQSGQAVQEAGQPIWFRLGFSGVMALPNGASQSGDTYQATTNSLGIATIPLRMLSTVPTGGYNYFRLTGSGTLGGDAGGGLEYTQYYHAVSSANYATQVTLYENTATLNGNTITVHAGTSLATVLARLTNAQGNITVENAYDELLFSSSNSGVVSLGTGPHAAARQLERAGSDNAPYGGIYPFGVGEPGDGLYAVGVGTATITVTDVSNAAMPSASFTVRVVPGPASTTPWIEYRGHHVSNTNPVPLPPNTPVELQVVNVDAVGDPIPVTGTTPLAVQLPGLPSGEYWQAARGGVSSSSMVVDIPPGQSSANVWLVSSTSAVVSGPAYGQDVSTTKASATGAYVAQFTGATTSTNGTMTIDLTYNAPLASGTVTSGSAFTVTDSTVSEATFLGTAAVVSGGTMIALTVSMPSSAADATVSPFDIFTVSTSSSAVDSVLNASDQPTAPVSVSTTGSSSGVGLVGG